MARAARTAGNLAMAAANSALAAAAAARQAREAGTKQQAAVQGAALHLEAQGEAPRLSASDRENPDKLAGDDLRALAHRRGIARSEAAGMDDAKLRMQLRYITNRQYADEEA